jgi:hypothetical protein
MSIILSDLKCLSSPLASEIVSFSCVSYHQPDPVSHLSEIIMLGNQPQLCYQFVAYTGNNEGTSLHESKPKKGSTMALISN